MRQPPTVLARATERLAMPALVAIATIATGPCLAAPAPGGSSGAESEGVLEVVCTLSAQHTARLGPEVSGRVQEVLVEVGDAVRKGQVVVRLDPALFEAALERARALAAIAEAKADSALTEYTRIRLLWEEGEGAGAAVTEQQRDLARARLEAAQARLKEAQAAAQYAQLQLERTAIRAPYDGVITARWVAAGDVVNAAPVTHLLEIQSRDPVVAEFSVPQRWLGALRAALADPTAHPVQLAFDGAPALEAPIERLWPQLDPATRSVRARVLLPNPEGLYLPGMLGRARLQLPVSSR